MDFNLSLSTNMIDPINYSKESSNSVTSDLKKGLFDDVLDKSFCEEDEREDIDYNLILSLLNNIELPNINEDNATLSVEENKVTSNIGLERDKVNPSNEEIKLLRKIDNIILGNKENTKLFEDTRLTSKDIRIEESKLIPKVEEYKEISNVEKNNYSIEIEENKAASNIGLDVNRIEQNFANSEYVDILNELEKVQSNIKNLNNNVEEVNLNNEEVELLKKLDNIILGDKKNNYSIEIEENKATSNIGLDINKNETNYESSKYVEILTKLVKNEKFSELENDNAINRLNLIRSDNSKNIDKDLDTLESIVNSDDNNLIINSSQLINENKNVINNNTKVEVPTIRQEQIGEDIIKTVKYLKSSNNEVITVKISPKELGDMTIKLTNDVDKSNVVITISKSEVFDLINDNKNEMVKHLEDLNINIKEVSIEMKDNAENNFSSNLSQEFTRNNQGNRHENRKRINLNDEEIDDIEEFYAEENINILI